MTKLMHKDLGLATDTARELEVATPILAIAKELMHMAKAKGFGEEDMSAVIKCYEEWAGVTVENRK